MIFSNIANADFLNEFYQKVVEYSEATYCEITESLIKDEYKYYITTYGQKELTAIIMLNQNFFQYNLVFLKCSICIFYCLLLTLSALQ